MFVYVVDDGGGFGEGAVHAVEGVSFGEGYSSADGHVLRLVGSLRQFGLGHVTGRKGKGGVRERGAGCGCG